MLMAECLKFNAYIKICMSVSGSVEMVFVCTWVCISTECPQSIVASTVALHLCSGIPLIQRHSTSTVAFNFYSCIVALHFYSSVPFYCGWNVRNPNCLWTRRSWQCDVEACRRSVQFWKLWKHFKSHGCAWERPGRPEWFFNFLAPAGTLGQFNAISNQGCYFDHQQCQETQ